ncbi:MAG: flagellar hook-basal body complex protein, partial [Deltaproteobacteria bacterium]|nr:flagellar hook-basal body complex protein [Deltaproteobacteria bacterium]
MSVVGDNLANAHTIGFKRGIPIFQDLLAQSISTYAGASQVGLGATTQVIWQDFTQGAFKNTTRALDLAVNGRGFFVVQNRAPMDTGASPTETGQYYTRAGAFEIDKNGYVINPSGLILQGYSDISQTSGTPSDLRIDTTRIDPQVSSQIDFSINLDPTTTSHSDFSYYLQSDGFAAQSSEVHNAFYYYLDSDEFSSASSIIHDPTGGADADASIVFSIDTELISINVADGTTLASVASLLSDALTAATNSGTVSIVSGPSSGVVLRIDPADDTWTIDNVTDTTDATNQGAAAGLDLDNNTVTSGASTATIAFSFGTSTAASLISITVADNETLSSVYSTLAAAFSAATYSATVTIVSAASGYAIRITSNNDNWSVQGSVTDTTTATAHAAGLDLDNNSATSTGTTFDATDSDTYDYSTSIYIYDQQGGQHTVNIYFEKVDDNTWNYYALAPDSVAPNAYSVTPGNPTGTLVFDEQGHLATIDDSTGTTVWSIDADGNETGTQPTATFTFVDDETGTPVDMTIDLDFTPSGNYGATTQNGNSFVNYFVGQDGYGPGSLESLQVDAQGVIMGQYSNGEAMAIARVALATFRNTQGLLREGSNLFSANRNSGEASINGAEEGGTGTILGFALEEANVDMAEEFVDMIIAQRAFQANAKVVSTSDQMLGDLMNIKR